jgi:hypothetical protein
LCSTNADGAALLQFLDIREWRTRRALNLFELHQVRRIVVQLGIDHDRLADSAIAHGFPHGAHGIAVEIAGSAGENASTRPGNREQLMGLLEIGRRRFFRIDVLAGFQCALDRIVVRMDARQVDDYFNLGIGEQCVVTWIDAETVVPGNSGRARGIDVEDTADFQLRMRPVCAHVNVEHVAASDESDLH